MSERDFTCILMTCAFLCSDASHAMYYTKTFHYIYNTIYPHIYNTIYIHNTHIWQSISGYPSDKLRHFSSASNFSLLLVSVSMVFHKNTSVLRDLLMWTYYVIHLIFLMWLEIMSCALNSHALGHGRPKGTFFPLTRNGIDN